MKLTHKQILNKFEALGLIENERIISFARFSNRATIRRYLGPNKVVFFGEPNKNLFGIYVEFDSDPNVMKNAYKLFVKLAKGNMELYENKTIQWCTCGIPDQYNGLTGK